MKPWFAKEADIIKFPEPKAKVIELPNVQSYPDFLTGVKDLHNRKAKGEISQDSHDKLYQDLIHRFMKKESFETPWFLREFAPDEMKANVQSTIANLDIKDEEAVKILKQLYTVLNKTGMQGRIKTVFSKDEDVATNQAVLDEVSDVFLKVAEKDPVEAKEFLNQFEKNPNAVNVKGLLSNPGKIVGIGAILAILSRSKFCRSAKNWETSTCNFFSEFSRSSQDLCESDYNSHKSWDDQAKFTQKCPFKLLEVDDMMMSCCDDAMIVSSYDDMMIL